jgi:hypothetical protein
LQNNRQAHYKSVAGILRMTFPVEMEHNTKHEEPIMELAPYLKLLVEKNGSDLYFSSGAPVNIKIEGVTEPLGNTPIQPGGVKKLVYPVLSQAQIQQFEQ